MSTENERLARIETHVVAIKEVLNTFVTRVEATERAQIEMRADMKMVKVGVGVALVGALGGGGAALTKILGLLG